ncbi:MAG: BamA/OMP85 family outer membrane protein [Fusobacteriaceae bacterium]
MRKYLVILLGVFSTLLAYADQKSLEKDNYVINSIELSEKEGEVPEDVVLSLISSKKGEKYSTEKMLEDYNRLIKENYVDELIINPKIYDGGIKLVITLKEKKNSKELLNAKGIVPNSERDKIDTTIVIKDVVIEGLVHLKKKDLIDKLPLKAGAFFSERRVVEGQRMLLETGYFRDVKVNMVEGKTGPVVVYQVLENPILNGINIIGNTAFSTNELLEVMKTKPGEVFSIKDIREDRERVLGKYFDKGYVLTEMLDIDINNRLELEFVISEGIVRDVQYKKMITKQKGDRRKPTDDVLKTKTFVIDREVEMEKNKIFNVNDYDETSKNLTRTGHFKNIKYDANSIIGDPDGRSVVLLIDEERTASLQGAISYGSEVGLLGMLALKDTNWAGRGQDLGVTYEKSDESYSSFSIDFYDPWIKGTDRLSWGWSIYKNTSEVSDSVLFNEIDTYGIKANIGKGLSKYTRLSLGTKFEKVEERADDGSLTDEYELMSLYPSLTYDTRNNYMNATTGEYAKLQLEGGYAGGNDADYFGNITLELRKYHRGIFKKNTFAYRLIGGIMTQSTKESQRFWVGGNSLRGYEGGYFQGTQKLTATIENRTQFNDVLGLVFFVDAGRAWDQNGRDPGYIATGRDKKFAEEVATAAGVGLRLNTPIGPLRFDFGWPIGKKIGETSGMQFYFNMGQSF